MNTPDSIPAPVSPPRWHLFYFALAAFDILTVCGSLYLSHQVTGIYAESVRTNQEWADRAASYDAIGQLASDVNAPGNDVFDSRKVAEEAGRMEAALKPFNAALAAARSEIEHHENPDDARPILKGFRDVETAMAAMVAEARLIFSFFSGNQPERAGERMATMDRAFAQLNREMFQLRTAVAAAQRTQSASQTFKAIQLRKWEFLIGACVILMVAGVTFYGHRISVNLHATLRENVEHAAALTHEIAERKQAETTRDASERQLRLLSRHAGMAEVATSVLHNVGNVLNSVNVSVAIASDKVSGLKVATLERLAAMLGGQQDLAAFFTSDPRGAELPAFVASMAKRFASDRTAVIEELDSLRRHVEHINEIVATQQSYANACGVTEVLPLADLIEDALRINAAAIERHGLHIVRDFADLPPVSVDRHKVLQILVNLIRNAKYALDDGAPADKRLTLRLGLNGGGRAKIAVSDNGVGIPAENLTRIFGHGFTTRKDGHGFGLHSGANAARELGGTLSAHSDGPGLGATFTLEIPLASDTKKS